MPYSDARNWVISHLHGDLLNQQKIRQWGTNPDTYSSGVTGSIFTLISRKFASPDERLQDVISREEKMLLVDRLLAVGYANLKDNERKLVGVCKHIDPNKNAAAACRTIRGGPPRA